MSFRQDWSIKQSMLNKLAIYVIFTTFTKSKAYTIIPARNSSNVIKLRKAGLHKCGVQPLLRHSEIFPAHSATLFWLLRVCKSVLMKIPPYPG